MKRQTRIRLLIFAGIVVVLFVAVIVGYFVLRPQSQFEDSYTENTSDVFKSAVERVVVSQNRDDNEEIEGVIETFVAPEQLSEDVLEQAEIPNMYGSSAFLFSYAANSFSIVVDGELQPLFSPEGDVDRYAISPNGEHIWFTTSQGETYYYSVASDTTDLISDAISEYAWSPSSDRVVYQFERTFQQDNVITVADPDGSNFSVVKDFGSNDFWLQGVSLEWLDDSTIIYQEQGSDPSGTVINTLDVATGAEGALEDLGEVESFKLSPDRDMVLYGVYRDAEVESENFETDFGTLFVNLFSISENRHNEIGLQVAVEKCDFVTNDQLVCAASLDVFSDTAPEILVSYTISSGEAVTLSDPNAEAAVNYQQMRYIESENALYYINNLDSKLYRVILL